MTRTATIDERRDVRQLLAAIPRDVTVVMIEHNMDVALDWADRITLLHFGEVIVEGKGKTVGLPDLRAGVKIQIKGLGERFSGTDAKPNVYLVTSTTHSLGAGGYTTDFTARMEKL